MVNIKHILFFLFLFILINLNHIQSSIDKVELFHSLENSSLIKNSNSYQKDNIHAELDKIPAKEKESLENLFRQMIIFQSVGYVIFGDKPMVWGEFFTNKSCVTINKPKIFFYDRLWDDYLIWKNHQNSFFFPNYIFRVYKSNYDESYSHFLFINKKKTIKCINKNIKLFKKKLGNSITPEEILQQLEKKENILEEIFKNHEDLLGILLGFGLHNSQAYQMREVLERSEKGRSPFDSKKVKDIYKINLSRFPSDKSANPLLNYIFLPYYAEDKIHPESVQLRQNYKKTQKVLCHIYSQGNFLKITLEALCKP